MTFHRNRSLAQDVWPLLGVLAAVAALAIAVFDGFAGAAAQEATHAHHGAPGAPSAAGASAMESHMEMPPPGPGADAFESEMYRDMVKMMRDMHAPGYSGDRDVDFLAMMIPHHQGAIDMARLVLIHGKDPLTRSLAAEIIASQQAEIEAMQGRLAALRAAAGEGAAAFPALSGTRGGPESQDSQGSGGGLK